MDKSNEYKRLKALLYGANIAEKKIEAMEPIIDNLSVMRIKLDEAMHEIEDAPLIVEYINGENQRGTHINPLFKAYEDFLKSYLLCFDRYINIFPKELQDQASSDVVTMLDKVKEMKKKRGAV